MKDPVILVVEDDPNDQELIRLCLSGQKEKHRLIIFPDGEEALTFLSKETAARPGLILLDLKLPKVSGSEVLKRLRSQPATKHVPVVVFTSSKEDRDISESYALGASAYVRKPIEFKEFDETLRSIVHFWISLNRTHPAS